MVSAGEYKLQLAGIAAGVLDRLLAVLPQALGQRIVGEQPVPLGVERLANLWSLAADQAGDDVRADRQLIPCLQGLGDGLPKLGILGLGLLEPLAQPIVGRAHSTA